MLQCTPAVNPVRGPRRAEIGRLPPIGCTRSFLIGPPTLFGPAPRHPGFSPEKTFPDKFICMGKQKNRLTNTKSPTQPARTPIDRPDTTASLPPPPAALLRSPSPSPPPLPTLQGTFLRSYRVLSSHHYDFASASPTDRRGYHDEAKRPIPTARRSISLTTRLCIVCRRRYRKT